MDLRMTPEERLAFLSEEPRVGVLSIDAPDRAPVASPVWYTVEADGAIAFSVGTDSQKTRLLRAAGRARRYLGDEFGDAYFASTRDELSLTFALRPQRWASVDYSKMF